MQFTRLLSIPLAFFGLGISQTVLITGRVLEQAALDPVPGATVVLKGYNLSTITDSLGNFTLSGNPVSLQPRSVEWSGPLMDRQGLHFNALVPNVRVETKLYDAKGKNVSTAIYNLESAGLHILPVLQNAPPDFIGFLTVHSAAETYHLKVFRSGGPAPSAEASFVQSPEPLALQAAAADSVQASMTGLISKTVGASADTNVGNIILGYPVRPMIGVGLTPPYGAKFLFDGSHGPGAAASELTAKWHEWWRFNVTGHPALPPLPVTFKIAKDPQYENDTNHATLRMCCETVAGNWGYNDIQEDSVHGDVQMHVEWIGMGKYDSTQSENPDSTTLCTDASATTSACWINSGVYIQSRFEIQIQSNALPPTVITANHDMGSITNEEVPSSNQNKNNGIWQSYDFTFRTARWKNPPYVKHAADSIGDTNALMTVWWNGVQTHLNHKGTGIASGTGNHSGEGMNDTLYGLKLQDELGDVRFRNIWFKKLRIDSAGTNFFY